MKCTSCNTHVSKIPLNWKCPHCNEQLPEPGFWFKFSEGLVEYLDSKGVIFWTVVLTVFILLIGLVEVLTGSGTLLKYLAANALFAMIMMFFGGMLIDMYFKVTMPLRIPFGSDFILRERQSIRGVRKITHFAGAIGIVFTLVWLKPTMFFYYFPSYFVVIGWFLALGWSIAGLFLDPKHLEDVRFRAYMDKLGITSLKMFRKRSTMLIGVLFLIPITFVILVNIPGLSTHISNSAILGSFLFFLKSYFSWML